MKNIINWILQEETCQGMVEYSLIISLIVLIALVGLISLKDGVKIMYENIATKFP